MNNHLQYRPRVIQVKLDEQVIETTSICLSPRSVALSSMTWCGIYLVFSIASSPTRRASFHFSLITALLHDLGLSFCCITSGRTVPVTRYGIRHCTLWFPRPAVAGWPWPQSSRGMRKDCEEVWTNQTNGGCGICIAGLSGTFMKSFLLNDQEGHFFPHLGREWRILHGCFMQSPLSELDKCTICWTQ